MNCRIFRHECADGSQNMGLDEALLDSVDADPSFAAFRTYEWAQPTLSLGYFQSIQSVANDPRWNGVPLVRRPSGGGALWHDRELTYALVVPRSHPLAVRPSVLYRAVHAVIADALMAAGIPAYRRGDSDSGHPRQKPFLCFLDHDPEDVLVSGAKIVGSAQRRRPSAVLQHGSVLLAKSEKTPELPGLCELAGASPSPSVVAQWLAQAISGLLKMDRVDATICGELHKKADDRAASVYRNPLWNQRR